MENRCFLCGQQLPVVVSTGNVSLYYCPQCNNKNFFPVIPRSGPRDQGCHRQAKSCAIGRLGAKLTKSLLGRNHDKPVKSLNCVPSPLHSSSNSSRPRKRALLCGVSYKKWKYRLKGPINDVTNMKELLISTFGFKENGILVLTEEETNPELTPTRKNIKSALEWLVKGCQLGDSLVFYFSGHGLQEPDLRKDERDGFDETICPTDYMKEGMILDNEINDTIVRPLVKGVTLHAIVDACHSGTVLDLLYVYDREKKQWKDNSPPSGAPKGTSGGLAISIAACEDDQEAADTTAFTGKTMNGVLTYILIDILKKNKNLTYGELLDKIHEAIKDVNMNDGCIGNATIFRRICKDRISQKPQLSSSQKFEVDKKPFSL